MNTFKLQIVAPDRIIYEGDASFLLVRAMSGDIGIQANHQKLVTPLTIGRMKVEFPDKEPRFAAITGGFMKVGGNCVTVLTSACEWEDEIDVDRASRARERAEEKLKDANLSKQERVRMEAKLYRALIRLDAAKK